MSEQTFKDLDPAHLYSRDHPLFIELVKVWEQTTQTEINGIFKHKIELIEEILNADYAIASYYIPIMLNPNIAESHPRRDILFSAYHRNLFALYTSMQLTNTGFFGPARSILRHVFESLVIAKFCSLSKSNDVYSRWQKGQAVYFTNSILNKIKKPTPTILKEYWGILSDFVHASIYAQQVSLGWDHLYPNIQFNWDLILALAECRYHLLVSHLVTPSVRYYSDYASSYSRRDDKAALSDRKKLIRSLFSRAKKSSTPPFRRLIKDFKQTWVLQP